MYTVRWHDINHGLVYACCREAAGIARWANHEDVMPDILAEAVNSTMG